MTSLLNGEPFGPRDDAHLLESLIDLTRHHLRGCKEFSRIWRGWRGAAYFEELPYLHAGLFKRLELKTHGGGIKHQRTLVSSSTSGMAPSQIFLDDQSAVLQRRSIQSIHRALLGSHVRPLLILDEAAALRNPGLISARIAAALSLQALTSETHLLLDRYEDPQSVRWDRVSEILGKHSEVLLYGSTATLWAAWAISPHLKKVNALNHSVRIDFIHSGGWKKMEKWGVSADEFKAALLKRSAQGSRVVDYYGLSEQVGVLFPLCPKGRRHAPSWSEVLIRDPYTLKRVDGEVGLLQLLNPLAWGAPYHSVLTEDLGRRMPGPCLCGWQGRHFELLGRVPQAEVRGCANV